MNRSILIAGIVLMSLAGCSVFKANTCVGEPASSVCGQKATEKGYGLPDYPGC